MLIFWHRRDLRLADNLGLMMASQRSPKVIGCFCFDPHILNRDDIAPARVKYLIGCLQELEGKYKQLGSQLLLLQGDPATMITQLATKLKAQAVYWNLDVEPYSQQRDKQVREALENQGIGVETYWDQLLHSPGEILTKSGDPYKVYTPFWKNLAKKPKQAPVDTPQALENLTETEQNSIATIVMADLPTPEELGYHWDNPLLLEPGETAAQARLSDFCRNGLENYEEQRNFPAIEGTSQLSAALKFGAISIRTVWFAAAEVKENSRSEETTQNIETWQQELVWREFYQHAMYFFPELANGPYREEFKDFPWDNNIEHFQAWCEGKTGYPIVDAAMRQLNQTGWMHNRCRMIVASFLTKDLIINWQWGEKYFMQTLYDGDLSANNGGWQWSASSGMDPKPLRIFNPASQGQKFDPEGEYIRQWLPELSSVDTEYLVTGKIPCSEREACGYPEPIVDHKQQQREFKRLYQEQKK
jgi:deoxyribodipyrimidine photo-lyase